MIKHVGKTDGKKVVVLFRQVPSEDHMCLIVFPDVLPKLFHDAVMHCLESAVGQQSENLGEPLGRELMADGRQTLQALHREGFIRKIQTEFIIMTPQAGSTVRLDELNKILTEMATGKEAIERLATLDLQAGMYNPEAVSQPGEVVLSDETLAQDQLTQAVQMEAEAKALVAEAKTLTQEAYKLDPSLKPKAKRAPAKKVTAKKTGKKKQKA